MNITVEDLLSITHLGRTAIAVAELDSNKFDYLYKGSERDDNIWEKCKDKKVLLIRTEPNYEDNGVVNQAQPVRIILFVA